MTEEKLACLFKTPTQLEIHIFDSILHSDGPINAFEKYENKTLTAKIKFRDKVKTSPMIADDFSEKYPEFHKDNGFLHFGASSDCKYDLSREEEIKMAFNEYFFNYVCSLSKTC